MHYHVGQRTVGISSSAWENFLARLRLTKDAGWCRCLRALTSRAFDCCRCWSLLKHQTLTAGGCFGCIARTIKKRRDCAPESGNYAVSFYNAQRDKRKTKRAIFPLQSITSDHARQVLQCNGSASMRVTRWVQTSAISFYPQHLTYNVWKRAGQGRSGTRKHPLSQSTCYSSLEASPKVPRMSLLHQPTGLVKMRNELQERNFHQFQSAFCFLTHWLIACTLLGSVADAPSGCTWGFGDGSGVQAECAREFALREVACVSFSSPNNGGSLSVEVFGSNRGSLRVATAFRHGLRKKGKIDKVLWWADGGNCQRGTIYDTLKWFFFFSA